LDNLSEHTPFLYAVKETVDLANGLKEAIDALQDYRDRLIKKLEPQKKSRLPIFVVSIVIMFVFGCIFFSSQLLGVLQSSNSPNNLSSLSPTVTPTAINWRGNVILVTASLKYADPDGFSITYQITNQTVEQQIISFLTSDILVMDNLGNQYKQRYDTSPVQDKLMPNGNYYDYAEHELDLSGIIPTNVEFITFKLSLSVETQPVLINIPIIPYSEKIITTLGIENVSNDGFRFTANFKNQESDPFILRANTNCISAEDNLENIYKIYPSGPDRPIVDYIGTGDYNEANLNWWIAPGIDPAASEINLILDNFMGLSVKQTIPLIGLGKNIRYEVIIENYSNYVNQTSVILRVFNLNQEDILVRFDPKTLSVTSVNGSSYLASDYNDARFVHYINPGNSYDFRIAFTGDISQGNDLMLNIPVISAVSNVQIPIQK
jgi:hypothetical protein